jgi:hypothetical protein
VAGWRSGWLAQWLAGAVAGWRSGWLAQWLWRTSDAYWSCLRVVHEVGQLLLWKTAAAVRMIIYEAVAHLLPVTCCD